MSNPEEKALELMAKTEKMLARSKLKGFLLSKLGLGLNNTDAAIECYDQAAIMFKIALKPAKAGEAYIKVAQLFLKIKDKNQAAEVYANAASCYKKEDIHEAIKCFEKAIELQLEYGYIYEAACHHCSIAKTLEAAGNLEEALNHYQKASDYFKAEDSDFSDALSLVADTAARLENYAKAIEIFEEFFTDAMKRNDRHMARKYFLKAAVCHLCVDVSNCEMALVRHATMYNNDFCTDFYELSEYSFMETLSSHVAGKDEDAFTKCVSEYDRFHELDDWFKTLLRRVKNAMNTKG